MLVDGLDKGLDSLRPHVRVDPVPEVGNPGLVAKFLGHVRHRGIDQLVRTVQAAGVQVTLQQIHETIIYFKGSDA